MNTRWTFMTFVKRLGTEQPYSRRTSDRTTHTGCFVELDAVRVETVWCGETETTVGVGAALCSRDNVQVEEYPLLG